MTGIAARPGVDWQWRVERQRASFHQDARERVDDALAHRPAEKPRVRTHAIGVPFRQQPSVLHDHDGARPSHASRVWLGKRPVERAFENRAIPIRRWTGPTALDDGVRVVPGARRWRLIVGNHAAETVAIERRPWCQSVKTGGHAMCADVSGQVAQWCEIVSREIGRDDELG